MTQRHCEAQGGGGEGNDNEEAEPIPSHLALPVRLASVTGDKATVDSGVGGGAKSPTGHFAWQAPPFDKVLASPSPPALTPSKRLKSHPNSTPRGSGGRRHCDDAEDDGRLSKFGSCLHVLITKLLQGTALDPGQIFGRPFLDSGKRLQEAGFPESLEKMKVC